MIIFKLNAELMLLWNSSDSDKIPKNDINQMSSGLVSINKTETESETNKPKVDQTNKLEYTQIK